MIENCDQSARRNDRSKSIRLGSCVDDVRKITSQPQFAVRTEAHQLQQHVIID